MAFDEGKIIGDGQSLVGVTNGDGESFGDGENQTESLLKEFFLMVKVFLDGEGTGYNLW